MKKAKYALLLTCAVGLISAGCGNSGQRVSDRPSAPPVQNAQEPEENYDNVQVQSKSQEDLDGHIKVEYPQLSGLKNETIQKQINADLEKQGKYSDETIHEIQGTLDYQKEHPETGGSAGYTSKYDVKFRKNNVFNFVFNSYMDTGGAHGMPFRWSYIVDVKTGKSYNLPDLFKPGSGYLYRLSELVKERDVKKDLDTFQPFSGVEPYDSVYLTNEGLTVFFQPYEHASYAQGFLEYSLNAQDFIDLINPDTPFAKLWGDVKPARTKESQETLVRDLVRRYETNMVDAVNDGNLRAVKPYLKPGSQLYQDQEALVKKLHDQGIYEHLVSYNIDRIDGNQVYVTDTIEITESAQNGGTTKRTETYRWIYTVDPEVLQLTNLAAWK
ncbi:DUF3298 and DUF4163 domain-containing protein [Tumebacillus flagellatus]|uniref:DUF3298 domain-containing protein n=1 Tax=Tumebacillus flagellatus TaxID=1157490 RepID=A0A074LUH6_9BACL|nr:DUF3298 and DUF4163 domain-containing protein [Tumebacillus flagellatus]KEO84240.1 hypothetical protein EL26_05600 [Tumebacillus flagellatus]